MRVLERAEMVPAKPRLNCAPPIVMAGATSAPARSAMPSATAVAHRASVPISPLGPCCPVEPRGTPHPFEPLRSPSTSCHVESCSFKLLQPLLLKPVEELGAAL